MDVGLKAQLDENGLNYKRALERIIDKYSKLQYQDGAMEVDLNATDMQTMDHYMKLSKMKMSKLESKSLTDLREESLRAQDVTRDSQLDFTHQDSETDESSVSTSQFSMEDDGMSRSDGTQLTVSSLEESERSVSETELQPEDQDEGLEMSLRNQGSSLVELYPSMITQIGRAWHRQHVSDAADSVLRRYRRWRRLSNRSNFNNTFNITLMNTKSKPRKMTSETLLEETFHSPLKRKFPGMSSRGAETAPLSPLHKVTSVQDWHTQFQSPRRDRGTPRREQHQPILVMDFSCLPETSEPRRSSLNQTFTVNQPSPPSFSQQGAQPSFSTVSSQPHYPSAKASLDLSPRLKRLPLSAHSAKTACCSTYASETTGVKERSDVYGSPVRQSPLKARMMIREDLGRSPPPHAFSRSPKSDSVSYSRESARSRSMAMFLSSPPKKPDMPLRTLNTRESHHSFQSQLHSPLSVTAAGRHKVRRHLSLDSSLPRSCVLYSQKELDDDFAKLYHKFVCQSKSSHFNGPPCRMCARSSDASRGHSSSALAALALSPHRSILRKRHRELDWGCHPQSKRSRDRYCTYSPGSKRHGKEMLTQLTQQPSADAHHVAWMSRGMPEFSGLGGSLESKMAAGYFRRKWW
ncbi:uncharacterized protein si:dkeyp-117h8.4 [Thunnus thynnus]|uniref:uncharacterized protein si:dkeyp-117h8.4 n=1 Tax=Thunnus thynnus TaxID=8237 RepID=UPI0035293D7C